MPGHKGGRLVFIEDVHKIDVTETAFTDDLYLAIGIIKESLERLKDFYSTKATYFLTNGSTVGILSAMSVHTRGEEVLLLNDCHKSVYNAIDIFGLKANFINEVKDENGINIGLNLAELEQKIKDNPNLSSFIITSPTYEGLIYDIKKISAICKKYKIRLIVDEAHGAHLNFYDKSLSAVTYADIVVQSVHKTLPAITSCGLIHINDESLVEKVFEGLKKFQTSSPSFIMMAEMDAVVSNLSSDSSYIDNLSKNMLSLKKDLLKLRNIKLLSEYDFLEGSTSSDICKLTLICKGRAYHIEKLLLEKGFVLEMCTQDYLTCIFTVVDKSEVFEKFKKDIFEIDGILDKDVNINFARDFKDLYSEEVFTADKNIELVDFSLALGKKSVNKIIPYPPGVPILLEGGIISQDVIEQISKSLAGNKSVYGIYNGKIKVFR